MRTYQPDARWIGALLVCALFWVCGPPVARAQEESGGPPEAAAQAETGSEAPAEPAAPPEAEEEKIPLNLKDASIDNVIDFIRKHTGKAVVKAKDVQAQITIATPGPVTPQTALELIIEALKLEGVAVVERDDVIQIMPVAKLAELGIETRAVTLKFADVSEVEKLVTPLLADGMKLVADSRSRQVFLTGPAEKLADIEKVIRQLDVLEIEGTQVQIFQLKYAEATEIAPVLEIILRDSEGAGARPGQGKPRQGGAPPAARSAGDDEVAIVAYPTANWLVVRAPKEKLEAAQQLIAQLDKEKPPELKLNVILVKHADARDLARQLSEVFRRRPGRRSVRDTIELSADQRSNALIVYATDENFALIEEVMVSLDTEESRRTETRSFDLTYADAEDVAEQLNELYSNLQQQSYYDPWSFYYGRRGGGQATQVRFVPERRTNSLIVIAPPAEFEEIEDLIAKLDEPISKTEVSPRIYHIRNMGAAEMTQVLNDTFGVQEESRTGGYYYYMARMRSSEQQVGRLYGKVRFVTESATNSVIVITNNKENLPIIEDLIHDLDRPAPEYANTMIYPLENADATDVADQLNTLFAPPGAGRPEAREEDEMTAYVSWLFGSPRREEEESPISNLIGKVRVVPDKRTNSLLITSAVQHMDVLRQLIRDLDIESPKVLIKVQLIEVVSTKESRIGVRYSWERSVFDTREFKDGVLGALGYSWSEVIRNTTLSADVDLDALIQFLQRNFDARILSEPSLVVNNNKEATLFVGAEVPYIKESQGEPGSVARNVVFDYRQVGTNLTIKPHINQKGKVVTTVALTSDQVREGEVVFGGFVFDTRNYETELAVEGDQTIVIGGILRQEQSQVIHKWPILGDIPLLNFFFRKKDDVLTTTELIAFITPTVLTSRADDDRATREERAKLHELDERLPQKSEPDET